MLHPTEPVDVQLTNRSVPSNGVLVAKGPFCARGGYKKRQSQRQPSASPIGTPQLYYRGARPGPEEDDDQAPTVAKPR